MQHVASALKNHVSNRPPAARPPQASDRASPTPFASLLDDNAPAPERPSPADADNRDTRAARSDRARPATGKAEGKAATSRDDVRSTGKTDKTDMTDKTDNTDRIANEDTTATDAKTVDVQPSDGKIAKPAGEQDAAPVIDGQLAEALVAAEAAVAPPADAMPTPATAGATVAALATPAGDAATASTPAKADALAAPLAGTDKAGNDAALAVKTAEQPHGEAKPQGPAGDAADKDANAPTRGEAPHGEHANPAHRATPAQANAAHATDAMTAAPKAGAEAAPPLVHSAPSPASAPTAPNPAATVPLPQPAAIPFAGVAVEIAGKALAGKNHFEIRLDPPELGRIEVRLDVDRDGNVLSRMIVDRADTLDLLRRDASGLERALQDAGLKTSDNGLQFSLRDQSAQQERADRAGETARLLVEDDMPPASDAAPRNYNRLAGLGGGVDIHV